MTCPTNLRRRRRPVKTLIKEYVMVSNTQPPTTCPECRADLTGDPIPEKSRELFGGAEHFCLTVGIYSTHQDKVVAWECPKCGHRWDREGGEDSCDLLHI